MNHIKLLRNLYRLKNNEKITREEMGQLQKKQLDILLEYAWDHSEFYRQSFENAGITRDRLTSVPLSAFPSIDKRILMEHFDELVTDRGLCQKEIRRFDRKEKADRRPYLGKYHVVHSSGSTGKPGYFVYDEEAWSRMLLGIIRGALWNMSKMGIVKLLAKRPRIIYIAATDGRYGGAMAVGGGIEGVGASQMHLDIKTPLSEWIEAVEKFRPNIIIGYPSAIKILGELAEQEKVRMRISRVVSCGEPLGAGLRDYLEKTFGSEVVNIYGASESLALGVETGREDGMLLFDDLNVIEVENGCMYLTCLYNFVQPLIRYKISDHLVLKEPAARSPFTRAEILLGRNEDLLWFEDGNGNRDFIHPLAVEGFCIEGLRDYQFQQITQDSFEMLAETTDKKRQKRIQFEILRQMNEILREKNLDYVQFYVRFVEEIKPDIRTGKKALIAAAHNGREEEAV